MIKRSDDEEDVPWPIENGNAKRDQARMMFAEVASLTASDPAQAETVARQALAVAESAWYWLEDTEFDEIAHNELHEYGRYVREHFPGGCHLDWDGGSYQITCPVKKAHKRMGLSPTIVGKRLCSICSQPVSECTHMPGRRYEVAGGPNPLGYCLVCHRKDCDEHPAGNTFRVRASVQVTDFTITEVSLVSRPVNPDARFISHPVDMKALRAHLGPEFEPGVRVDCSACLSPCEGVLTLDVGPDES